MFLLVLFTDLVYHICAPKDVSAFKSKCPAVKYIDKKKYTARIVAVHENRELLQRIKDNLSSDVGFVHLQHKEIINKDLPYSEVLKKNNVGQDVSKLYLDATVLPVSTGQSSENYVFSFQEKETESNFFDKQPNFVEIEIVPAEHPQNPILNCAENPISEEDEKDIKELKSENLYSHDDQSHISTCDKITGSQNVEPDDKDKPENVNHSKFGTSDAVENCCVSDTTFHAFAVKATTTTSISAIKEDIKKSSAGSLYDQKVVDPQELTLDDKDKKKASSAECKSVLSTCDKIDPQNVAQAVNHEEEPENVMYRGIAVSDKVLNGSDKAVGKFTFDDKLEVPATTEGVHPSDENVHPFDMKATTTTSICASNEETKKDTAGSLDDQKEVDTQELMFDDKNEKKLSSEDRESVRPIYDDKIDSRKVEQSVNHEKDLENAIYKVIAVPATAQRLNEFDKNVGESTSDDKNDASKTAESLNPSDEHFANVTSDDKIKASEIVETSNMPDMSIVKKTSADEKEKTIPIEIKNTTFVQLYKHISAYSGEELLDNKNATIPDSVDLPLKIPQPSTFDNDFNVKVQTIKQSDKQLEIEVDENCNTRSIQSIQSDGRFRYNEKTIIHSALIKIKPKPTTDGRTDDEIGEVDRKATSNEMDTKKFISKNPSTQHERSTIAEFNDEVEPQTIGQPSNCPLEITNSNDLADLKLPRGFNILDESGASIESQLNCDTVFNALISGRCYVSENVADIPAISDSFVKSVMSSTLIDDEGMPTNSQLPDTSEFNTDAATENIVEDSTNGGDSSCEVYRPSPSEHSDVDMESGEDEHTVSTKPSSRDKRQKEQKTTVDITLGANKLGASAPDDALLVVENSKETASYAKKHFCLYCYSFKTKIARHLEVAHSDKDAVKEFSALKPGDAQRQELIRLLRNEGNNLYNMDPKFNKGTLLVVRRPQQKMNKDATDFIACGNCKGQHTRKTIGKHWRKCTNLIGGKERLIMVKGRKVSARLHAKANDMVRTHVFPYLREDTVVRSIRYDELLIQYANKQTERYGARKHQYGMIRSRLRLLGRFLQAIKAITPAIREMADVFVPQNYDAAVKAAKILGGLHEKTLTFDHPANATSIGTLLKHTGEVLRTEYIKTERRRDQVRVEDFLKLLSEDYTTSVNRLVAETQLQNQRRKKVILPSTDDITKLHNFLAAGRNEHAKQLEQRFSNESWRKLSEYSLISLLVFNRRRAGEIERVYVDDFNAYQAVDKVTDKDAYEALSAQGQAIARKYVRFMIRGKRNRSVPVLVSSTVFNCLNVIIRHRDDAGVPINNPYLFGIPSSDDDRDKYLRACDLLRVYSVECGAAVPTALRGTQLRKHIATKCINLNLSENQVTDLANFMGHHKNIHTEIYRQPVIENDIVKISQLLEMAQGTHSSNANNNENSSSDDESDTADCDDIPDIDKPGCSGVKSVSMSTTKTSNANKSGDSSRAESGYRPWTSEARNIVLSAFRRIGKVPSGEQLQKLINDNECLRGRNVPQLRTWLHIQKKKMG